jgi:hypothetical protein
MAEGKIPLTVDNYITLIKQLSERERNKYRASELIEIILQLPDPTTDNLKFEELSTKLDGIHAALLLTEARSMSNAALIINVDAENKLLKEENNRIILQNDDLKTKINTSNEQIDNIEQYLRVNNIEIVGIPTIENAVEEERVILQVLNSLEDITVTANDIDICHPIPTRRTDGKSVHIVKFISRKMKIDILAEKKRARGFSYHGSPIFINEHLAPNNRKLFADASTKKRELEYKYLWTRNGFVHMRKSDTSPIIFINNGETLNNLI